MNLIAASDFRNPDPQLIEAESELLHEMHIHKGCRFSIGKNLPLEKLSQSQKNLVATLNREGRIVSDTQKDLVARIDAEVEHEKKKNAPASPAAKK